MQHPTCTGIRVRSPADAHVIFHAVSLKLLPMITRRLDTEERRAIRSGCVFVWEERGAPSTEPMGLGIERWTDSIRWGPSRVREEFLFYHEREPEPIEIDLGYDSETASPLGYAPTQQLFRENLIKQTYSVFVETPNGQRKWHLIAYFTQESIGYLRTVDDHPYHPFLAQLHVPCGIYKSARSAKGTARHRYSFPGPGHGHAHPLRPSRSLPRAEPPPRALDYADPPVPVPISPAHLQAVLAPLEFLESIPPPCRHPMDEKALMSFYPDLS